MTHAGNTDSPSDRVPLQASLASATGRYRSALDALAEYLSLVVIERRAWRGESEVILIPETVVINENLDVAGPRNGRRGGAFRSRLAGHY